MSREIKFRAWDKKEQCWVNGFSIHSSGLFSDMIKGEINKSGVCVANCDWQDLNKLEHIHIMQYTGLKDKNGKEIYEGDIYKAKMYIVKNGKTIESIEVVEDIRGDNVYYYDEVEVIGNIFEDGDLLNDSKEPKTD